MLSKLSEVALITFFVLGFMPHVNSLDYVESLDNVQGVWTPLRSFVNFTVEKSEYKEGIFSLRFDAVNVSGWMDFAYIFKKPQNLSKSTFIVVWIKIQNTSIKLPLILVLDDVGGRKRNYRNFVDWFGLRPMRWAKIAVDLSNFVWEDPQFDESQVTRMRFLSFNGEQKYSQSIWVDDLRFIIYKEEKAQSIYNGQTRWLLISGILFFLFAAFLVGFLTFQFTGIHAPLNSNLPLMLPIYLAVGISNLALFLVILSFIYIDIFLISIILISALASFVGINIVNFAKCGGKMYSYNMSVKFLLPIVLLVLSFVRFAYFALSLGWAPFGDPQAHGKFTSFILYHHRIPFSSSSMEDILPSPFRYPIGFNVLSAFVSIVTNLYPGQSILVVGTAITMLFPSLLFSAIYLHSNSVKISLVAYLLAYFLPGGEPLLWRPSHDLLLGNFLTGTYPTILGNMVFIVLFALILSYENHKRHFQIHRIYILLTLALAVLYFPLLPFAILFFLLRFMINQRNKLKSFSSSLKILIVFATLIIVTGYVYINKLNILNVYKIDMTFNYEVYMRYPLFAWGSPYLIYTISIFAALPFSIVFIFKDNMRNIGLLYQTFFLPLMCAQHKQIYMDFLWFLTPDRALILLVCFSYLVLLIGIANRKKIFNLPSIKTNQYLIKVRSSIKRICSHKLGEIVITVIVLLMFTPSIIGHISYSYPIYDRLPQKNDFAAMEWLAKNVKTNELILNDRTGITQWLTSFKAMNIINDREVIRSIYLFGTLNGTFLANRTVEANMILDYPWDYEMIKCILSKYNISYIYISEEKLRSGIDIGRGKFVPPPPWRYLNQRERVVIYLQNPILRVVYRSGDTVIFKVVKEHFNTTLNIKNNEIIINSSINPKILKT
jgi:hypothetical protein